MKRIAKLVGRGRGTREVMELEPEMREIGRYKKYRKGRIYRIGVE